MACCRHCLSENVKKNGIDRNGALRQRCKDCGRTWVDALPKPLGTMRLPVEKAVDCLKLLLDGMSIRAVERFTGVCRDTIGDLILKVGENCQRLLQSRIRNVRCYDLEIDEVWSFISAKQKTCDRKQLSWDKGDCYCFLAAEANSKLIVHHRMGKRDIHNTREFIHDLSKIVTGKCQISTDGWAPYQFSIPSSFGPGVDFGVVVKQFGRPDPTEQRRYSPAKIIRVDRKRMAGQPEPSRICTSHIERGNLNLRMCSRRWTRLTNGFSKSLAHHEAAMAIYVAHHNFCRIHSTVKTTPAHAHGITDRPWSLEDLLNISAAV